MVFFLGMIQTFSLSFVSLTFSVGWSRQDHGLQVCQGYGQHHWPPPCWTANPALLGHPDKVSPVACALSFLLAYPILHGYQFYCPHHLDKVSPVGSALTFLRAYSSLCRYKSYSFHHPGKVSPRLLPLLLPWGWASMCSARCFLLLARLRLLLARQAFVP